MDKLSKEYGKRVRVNSPGSRWNGQYGTIVRIFYGIQFDSEKDLNLYHNIIEEHVEEAYELTEPEKVKKEDTSDLWTVLTFNDKRYYSHGCHPRLFDFPWPYCPLCGKSLKGVDYDRKT